MARPKLQLDEKLIANLARIHCSNEEIALIVGCSTDTLERRYAGIIQKAKSEGKMSLRRKQVEVAMSGNAVMLIWLGKQVLGQRDSFPDEQHTQPIVQSVYKLHDANKPDTKAS